MSASRLLTDALRAEVTLPPCAMNPFYTEYEQCMTWGTLWGASGMRGLSKSELTALPLCGFAARLVRSQFMDSRIRVLVAKPGLDGHDRGAKVIARSAPRLWHGGGLYRTPPNARHDRQPPRFRKTCRFIGLSILSGAHNAIVPRVMELLKEKGMTDVVVIVGGIVPDEDAAELKRQGVGAVFQPGASLEAIACRIHPRLR